ncbi:MAG TPA: PASTA domain-containing protein [Pyrinomonadaceae bacterium]|nr:PASTA domain-containing protein [Pyrinomonadaceae bacterium]
MSFVTRVLSVFRRISIVVAIAIAFVFGVGSTVYLSLRSPEVTVPNVVGKDRFEAEKILADADLNFRIRASRPTNQSKPDTVVFQLPRAGEVVKAGQTVAMDISRPTKVGETPETVKPTEESTENRNSSANENRPRRPKNKNENGNANANTNATANQNANANRPANANRVNANATVETPTVPRANSNLGDGKSTRPAATPNENRRPVAPRPTPSTSNDNRQNR